MRQDVYENLPLAPLAQHFDPILSSAYTHEIRTWLELTNQANKWIIYEIVYFLCSICILDINNAFYVH